MTFTAPVEPEVCNCGVPDCRCGRCHGTRWIEVSRDYVMRQVPDPLAELGVDIDPSAAEYVEYQVRLARAAHTNSVYPCRACAPSMFFRWRGGHLASDHDRERCTKDECNPSVGGRR